LIKSIVRFLLVWALCLPRAVGSSNLPVAPIDANAPVEMSTLIMRAGFPVAGTGNIYFASPAVVDLDQDGKLEILSAGGLGCVYAWRQNGQLFPGFPLPMTGSTCNGPRINGAIAVADVDGDGKPEIAAGNRGLGTTTGQLGKVFLWRADGTLMPGYPKEMVWNGASSEGGAEIYSVALGKISSVSGLQVIAATSNNAAKSSNPNELALNLHAWQYNGTPLPGFPTGYRTAGIWGQVGLSDINRDGLSEVFTGRDHMYVHGYWGSGSVLSGWPVHTYVDIQKTTWGVDPYLEFTRNSPAMGDIDGDGQIEIAIVGVMRDPLQGHQQTNSGLIVVNSSGQRKPGWESAKLVGGIIYSLNHPSQAPALADLDGDGKLEIIATFTDGTARAYRHNGSLMWSYNFAAGKILYASEPVVGDVTGDNELNVVFGTYNPDDNPDTPVGLFALDRNGNQVSGYPLPLPNEHVNMRGLRAAPTLADLDGDCRLEILAGSRAGWVYVWNTGVPYYWNRMAWFTSRHDFARTGSANGPLPPVSTCSLFNLQPKVFLPRLAR